MHHNYLLSLTLLALTSNVFSQETEGFQNNVNAGFTLTNGNSDTTMLILGAESKNIQEKQETLFSASYEYGQTTDTNDQGVKTETTNTDRAKAEAQSNWFLSKKMYTFYNLTTERDTKTKLDYRVTNGPGFGYYFLRNDDYLLSTESSVVYVVEEFDGNTDDYAAFRLAQKFEHTFVNGAKIWQSFETLFEFSDLEQYSFNAEIGAEAKLNGNLSLRVVLKDKYDNAPAKDVERNDLTFISGISVRI